MYDDLLSKVKDLKNILANKKGWDVLVQDAKHDLVIET